MSKLLADNVWFKVGDAYYKLSEWIGGMVPFGTAAGKFLYTTAAKVWAEADITAAGRAILDDASAAAQATTLGLGTGDSPTFNAVTATTTVTAATANVTSIELGHASDTTITRTGPGAIAVEGVGVLTTASGAPVRLNGGTISSSQATLDIVLTSYTAYSGLKLVLANFLPVTDDVNLRMRVSTDGGSTYDAGASDYAYETMRAIAATVTATTGLTAAQMQVTAVEAGGNNISNVAAEGGVTVEMTIYDQANTGVWPSIQGKAHYWNATATFSAVIVHFVGRRKTAQDTDAIRILFSSGDIASGKWSLYGYP